MLGCFICQPRNALHTHEKKTMTPLSGILIAFVLLALSAIAVFMGYMKSMRRYLAGRWASHETQPTAQPDSARQPGVLYVHVPDLRPWGHPNASPYSLKLETWLRLNGIAYTVVRGFDLKRAPKGKIPWIELDGIRMGDSELIIQFLKKRHALQSGLSPEQQAASHAFNRLVSEHTAACMGYARNVQYVEETLKAYTGLAALPLGLRLIAKRIRKGPFAKLQARGLGAHSPAEIYQMGIDDMTAIANHLGNKPFMNGDATSDVDASVFAMLASIAWVPLPSWPMQKAFFELPVLQNLQPYLLRVRDRAWSNGEVPWFTSAPRG